ncbi:MAG: hypothetical protein WC627_05580 [Legionella sp.]|jgi:hypothetical protein
MKTLSTIVTISLIALSAATFADKIIITGEPVILEQNGAIYTLPSNYKPSKDYYYVTVNGEKKICYLADQPTLASLNPVKLDIQIGTTIAKLTCYSYDETYFNVAPQ